MPGILDGIRIVEFGGQGPGPFCGMLLADLGADVILIERHESDDVANLGPHAIVNRGKRSVVLDLKKKAHVEAALRLLDGADALIEGFRPGVMERLGLGPVVCAARNAKLAYGRMTGWGQTGPLATSAGHDLNYIALSGALWYASPPGQPAWTPPTLVGDAGGGALYLALGILATILHVRAGGTGRVVDAAIVDGSANLTNLLLSVKAAGLLATERGRSFIDGSHWYATYRCGDGREISVGAIEPKFYRTLLSTLGIEAELEGAAQYDPDDWERGRAVLARVFATRTRAEWCAILEGTDCCFAPVLDPDEAAHHPHLRARGTYTEGDGVMQAASAPRIAGFETGALGRIPGRGEHSAEILAAVGLTPEDLDCPGLQAVS